MYIIDRENYDKECDPNSSNNLYSNDILKSSVKIVLIIEKKLFKLLASSVIASADGWLIIGVDNQLKLSFQVRSQQYNYNDVRFMKTKDEGPNSNGRPL